jgi:hypothetical protein
MNFNFTPYDILTGRVDYSLEDFLRNLFEQTLRKIAQTMPWESPEWRMVVNGGFKQNTEVCYALAEGYTIDYLCEARLRKGSSLAFDELALVLKDVAAKNIDNIEIIRVIVGKEMLSARKMGVNEKDARSLIMSEINNIVELILEEEGLTNKIKN